MNSRGQITTADVIRLALQKQLETSTDTAARHDLEVALDLLTREGASGMMAAMAITATCLIAAPHIQDKFDMLMVVTAAYVGEVAAEVVAVQGSTPLNSSHIN